MVQRILLLLLSFSSCNSNDKIPDIYIDRFYQHQNQANNLVAILKIDKFLEGKCGHEFNKSVFKDTIRSILNELGIEEVYCFSWSNNERQFDLKTNWGKHNSIHITYNSRDSIETIKGFYRKDINSNEIWGLGNNWALWIERKLIDADR